MRAWGSIPKGIFLATASEVLELLVARDVTMGALGILLAVGALGAADPDHAVGAWILFEVELGAELATTAGGAEADGAARETPGTDGAQRAGGVVHLLGDIAVHAWPAEVSVDAAAAVVEATV